MPTLFSILVIIAFLILLQLPIKGEDAKQDSGANSPRVENVPKPESGLLSRDEITNRLRSLDRLSEEAANKPPPPMAMCYKPIQRQNDPVDFLCAKCGAKTSHGKDDLRVLDRAHEVFKSLSGVKANLDERHFCASCNKSGEFTGLILEVKLPDSETPTRTEITDVDLGYLERFLKVKDWDPKETGPDAKNIPERIHKMLGIPSK